MCKIKDDKNWRNLKKRKVKKYRYIIIRLGEIE